MTEINLDATNAIVGRLASYAAKQALLGNTINILNCEKAVFTGKKKSVLEKYHTQLHRGTPFKGPFLPRMADRFVRRVIRGMLPYKQPKGKAAFERVMCYIGVPTQFQEKQLQKAPNTDVTQAATPTYVTVATVCKNLGGKQ